MLVCWTLRSLGKDFRTLDSRVSGGCSNFGVNNPREIHIPTSKHIPQLHDCLPFVASSPESPSSLKPVDQTNRGQESYGTQSRCTSSTSFPFAFFAPEQKSNSWNQYIVIDSLKTQQGKIANISFQQMEACIFRSHRPFKGWTMCQYRRG